MYKDGVLTISDFGKGAANSPIEGFGHMEGVEIFDTPGVVKIGASVGDATGGTTLSGLIVAHIKDKSGDIYQLSSDGKLYKNYNAIQTGLGTGWDLVIVKDYLFVRHSTVISVYGPLSGPAVWYLNWSNNGAYLTSGVAFTSAYYGKMLVSGDPDTLGDSIFLANGNNVAKIKSITTGTPITATYDAGLTLPDNRFASALVNVGDKIFIGASAGASWQDRTNHKVADIYPWDKVSADAYSLPVRLNESGIHALISDNNRVYAVAGTNGNIYVTDTTNYIKIRRLPWVQQRGFNQTLQVYPNAIALNNNGNLLVGTSTLSDSYNSNTSQQSFHGVYEVGINNSGYPSVLKYAGGATGTLTGATVALSIGSVYSGADDSITYSWQSGSTYGINVTSFRALTGYLESPLIVLGSRLSQKTFQNLEFTLTNNLTTDQSIAIYYRETLGDTYTLIGTYSYATLGAVLSHNTPALIVDKQQIQIKVILTQTSTTPSTDNINLLNIRIW